MRKSESQIQREIVEYFKSKGYFIARLTGAKGDPDLVACVPDGRFVALEIKRDDKQKPTIMQKRKIKQILENGGIAFATYSLDHMKTKLNFALMDV